MVIIMVAIKILVDTLSFDMYGEWGDVVIIINFNFNFNFNFQQKLI